MRYAICNETFEGWDHARVCRFVAALGYEGLEVASFTVASRVTDVTPARRRELRAQAEEAGLRIVGLHWLLAKTEGFQLTSAEESVRRRTADYLVELARFCRDLDGELMVFGSPAQRRIPPGATRAQAVEFAVDTFGRAMRGIEDAEVKVCLEPLAAQETDFINSCAEALEIVERIGRPNFLLHLDVKAMAAEVVPAAELIRRHAARAGHFHANDANRRGPGFGDTDFVPIFRALKASGYSGWVSVEVFDYAPDPETIARESLRYMKECEARP
jgi:sugar phosphate isomerase/epimerase